MSWMNRSILDAVDRWADGYWLLRETGIAVEGRIDGLLVPVSAAAHCQKDSSRWFWERPRLIGVEVKNSRADFLRGLSEGQFDRYDKTLAGVYVVTPAKVCKADEIPPHIGVLRVRSGKGGLVCGCLRHPRLTDVQPEPDVAWRLMFAAREAWRDERGALIEKYETKLERVGRIVGARVHSAILRMERDFSAKGQ